MERCSGCGFTVSSQHPWVCVMAKADAEAIQAQSSSAE